MADAAVLIPFRPGDPDRERALEYVLSTYAMTGWPVSLADDGDREGPWVKGAAIARALHGVRAEVYVVADADVVVSPAALELAITALANGDQRWALPHDLITRLDRRSTTQLIETGVPGTGVDRQPYRHNREDGSEAGGMVVLTRKALLECPMDPRFLGWGSEDEAWGHALRCLYGEPWRGEAMLYHLHHEHAMPGERRSPLPESAGLLHRYRLARRTPSEMRKILAEQA